MAKQKRNEDEEKQQGIELPDYGGLVSRVNEVITAQKSEEPQGKAYKPDYDSFARNHDAHVLSSSRAALSTMPQAQRALDSAAARAGKTLGYDVGEQESALYRALRATGITQTAAGNTNLYEANMETLWRSMRAIPDKKRRETAYNTLKALTKTKGSRFYKTSLPTTEADRSYIDTLDMPKAAYDEWADAVSGQFYSDSAHEADNRQAYARLYEAAVAGAGNDTQKYWRVQALDDAYELATGRRAPRGEAAAGTLGQTQKAQEEGEAEEKPGFWQGIVDAITSPTVTPALPAADQEQSSDAQAATAAVQETPAPLDPPAQDAASDKNERLGEEQAIEQTATPAPSVTPAPAPAPEKQGPVQQDVRSAQPAEVQGPVQQTQSAVPASGAIDLTGDAERAFVEYALTGRGDELDEATREAVNTLADSSRTARALLGLDATDSAALYDRAERSSDPGMEQESAQRADYLTVMEDRELPAPFILAQANVQRWDSLYGDGNARALGATLGGALSRVEQSDFPQELRSDARGAILQIGLAAEEAARNGGGNLYESYIQAHPEALEAIDSVFSAVNELEQERIAQAKEAEEKAALDAAQRLELAQAHMRSGDYTPEDRALVLANAPVLIARDAAKDGTYRALAGQIDEAMTASLSEDGGWFNRQTERYLAAQGLPMSTESIEARDYKRILAGYAADEVLADVRVAHALGYDSLAAYYADVGTPTVEALCARASLTMERVGGAMTDADMETASAIADDPLGTAASAQDSSYGEAITRGVQSGAATAGADVLEAYLTARQISEAESRMMEAQTRKEYADTYGAALSSYMARAMWEAAIQSGALPNEEWAQYAREYLDAGGDPFKLGPAPEVGLARTTQRAWLETARRNAEYAAQHMTQGQQTAYGIATNSSYNLTFQTASIGLSMMTGSPALGMMTSFGAASYAQETREQLAKGPGARTLAEVNAIGLSHAASDTIANVGTSAALEGRLIRAFGLSPAIAAGAARAGGAGAARSFGAMVKAFGKGFAKGATEQTIDEVFVDEFKERWFWSLIGTAENAIVDGAGIVEAAGKTLAQVADPFDDMDDVIDCAPEGFLSMLPMIFLGGVGDGVSAVRTAFPKTARAAQQVTQSGDEKDARAFVEALNEEIAAPGAKEELNAAMQAQAAGLHAAAELAASPELQEKAAQAQKTAEQAEAHRQTVQAETQRAANAQEAMRAAQSSGDVDGELAAADEYMKAVHNAHEAAGEAQQRTLEADRQAEAVVSEAVARGQERAAAELAETARLMAGMAERFMEQEDSLLARQVQRRMDWLMDRANAAMEQGDMETADELLTQYGALSMMLDDQTHARESETPEEREAFLQQARDFYEDMIAARAGERESRMGKWQTALERAQGEVDTLAQEAREMGGVYRELRGRKIHVTDAQARELLAVTGLRRIGNFNAQYGTRLTRSERDMQVQPTGREKPPVRLDDWLRDLQDEHPGALSAQWDEHPEYALLALAQRAQTMKQRTQAAQDRLESAQRAYDERAAQTECDMAQEQVQLPPGEALNQYANETYPQAEDSIEEVAAALRGTSHTMHTQEAMRTQAEERVARDGLRATVEALLKAEHYTDADVYAAHLCQRILKQRGDKPLHAALTLKLDSQLSQTGQTLRAQQEQRRRTAAGAVADVVEQADNYNRRHNRGALTYDTQAALDGLDSAQLAVGSTDAQPFLDSQVSRGTSDPVMQKLASDVAMRSGGALRVYWADMEDVRGFYDRERGIIVLSQRAGAGEAAAMAALHEYTHYMETQPGYEAYAGAMLRAAYGEDWQTSSAYRIDSGLVRDSYAGAGQELTDADLQKELVAQAAERIITGDEAFQRSMFGTKDGAAVRVLAGLDHFLARDRAKREGQEAENRYALLRQGRDAIRRAVQGKAQGTGEAQSGGVQYALGWTKDGERVVRIEEDILNGVPQKDWAKTVKAALKEKYPNGITVGNNLIQITKKSRKEIVNAHDTMWLKANQPDVYADKLRAANNAGEIVQASSDYVNEGLNHERKDDIVDFARGKVNIEVGGQMYSAEVVVGTRENGDLQLYDFVRMTKKEMQRTGERESAPHSSHAASLSDTSVAQGTPDVNTQSMPDSVQYALQAPHYDYAKPFAQQVEDWMEGKIPKRDTLLLGKTPEVLTKIGFSGLPLTIDQKHMRYVLGKPKNADHNLGVDVMKKLPELIANPIAIIENSEAPESGVLVIFAQKNENADGRQLIGAVNVSSGGSFNGISVEATRLQTVHSRGDLEQRIAKAVQKEKDGGIGVYYINKEAIPANESGQSQVLGTLGRDGFLHSILDEGSPVNTQSRDQTQTAQFKRWFGKSKVVDEDGKPLIVYHGSDADFDAFDMTRGRANMDIQGAFFSPYEDDAAGYGGNVRAFYLSIKNPADERTAYRALNRFKGQNNAGVKAREYLQSLGYDGVYNGYDEYIAFEPTQIKSATDNVGLFDPQNPNVKYALQTETDTGASSGRLTGDRQIRITEPETADAITAAEPDGDIALREQPDAEQTDFEAQMRPSAAEQTRRATANIEAMEAQDSDVSTDNPWRLPINDFQRGLIRRFGLENEKLPGVNYNRATVRQRALCAILASPQDELGAGRLTLTQQLEYMSKGRLSLRDRNKTLTGQIADILSGRVAVVTEADLNYIMSQAAIVEACAEFDKEGVPADREGQIAYRRMLEAQANTQPQGLLTMTNALRYMNMLSGPATAIRNVVGNTLMYGADNLGKAAFGQWIDAAVSRFTGTRTMDAVTREERRAGVDAGRVALRNAFDDAFVAMADTNPESRYDMADSQGRVFQNDGMEAARTIVRFAMEGDDRRRIAQAIEEEAAAIRRIGMKVRDETAPIGERRMRAMTEEEVMAEARKRAMERYFHNQNALSKWLSGEKGNGIGATLLRFIIPFVKTPTNVALRMMDFSPLGLAKAAVWDGLIRGAAGKFDQRAFVMGMTRGLSGTAITLLGYALYGAGVLKPGRGDEKDKNRRELLAEQGVPYGSYIELFGQMHELSFTMPAMAGLEIGKEIARAIEEGELTGSIVGRAASASLEQLFENSYLQTLANMTTRNGGTGMDLFMNAGAAVIEGALTQIFSPSWLRAIAKAFDPYVRDTTDSNAVLAAIKKTVIQNWPGLRQTLPAVSGVTGEGMTQGKAYQPGSRWESGVAAFLDAILTPTATCEKRDDAALSELLDLSYRASAQGLKYATSFLPEKELISSKKNELPVGKKLAEKLGRSDSFVLELSDSERRYANALYSRILFGGTGTTQYLNNNGNPYNIQGIRAYMAGRDYALASDEERIDKIRKMKDAAEELVVMEIMRGME